MRYLKKLSVAGALLLFGAAGCADLTVPNLNDPDAARALESGADVQSLIAGAFNTWHQTEYEYYGMGMALSNVSFQHNAPWANAGMEFFARIPREPIVNNSTHADYGQFAYHWYGYYRSLAAVADGLRALDDPDVAGELSAEQLLRARAYGKFMQGLNHASLALLYDQMFVVDESTDIDAEQEPLDYQTVMGRALDYFDEAISLSQGASFTIPSQWITRDISADELVRWAYSAKARYRANVARTPEERAAVDWNAVVADIDNGVTDDLMLNMDYTAGFFNWALYYGTRPGWSEMSYFIIGMADNRPPAENDYHRWLNTPVSERRAIIDDEPVLIVTPDERFPQGNTVEEQIADSERENATEEGRKYVIPQTTNGWGHNIAGVWARPDRGTWRWSYYWHAECLMEGYCSLADYSWPEIDFSEMQMLRAEAALRGGDNLTAAMLINETRTAAGLNPTDPLGTNTSCVPRLPNGDCGDLFEMMKWEKRMEVRGEGLMFAPWYFDGRGWGDLYAGTFLQIPIPCRELDVLGMLPCYTFGGGEPFTSPGSTYAWPHEG